MPELSIDEFVVLEALEKVYRKNRTQFTNNMYEWAPEQFEPVDRHQWLTETELMDLVGSKLPGMRFHNAVFAVSETLEAAQRQEFSGVDPGLGSMPFAVRVTVDGHIAYLDQSFRIVSKRKLGVGESPDSIETHERLRIVPRGLQLLREFRQSPEGQKILRDIDAALSAGSAPSRAGDQTLVDAKRLAAFAGCDDRVIRNALAHCPRAVDGAGRAGHSWKYCDALHVLSSATTGIIAKVEWPDLAKDLAPSKKSKST